MRAFVVACLAFIAIGAGGYFVLDSVQEASGTAYTSDAARIDPSWSWRATSTTTPQAQCTKRESWQWFFVDLHDPNGESGLCSYSQ